MAIVELANSGRTTLAPLFGRLELMMLGGRFRIPRYVWSVAKPWGRTGSGEGCRSGHRENSDQSASSDKKLVHDDSPLTLSGVRGKWEGSCSATYAKLPPPARACSDRPESTRGTPAPAG